MGIADPFHVVHVNVVSSNLIEFISFLGSSAFSGDQVSLQFSAADSQECLVVCGRPVKQNNE